MWGWDHSGDMSMDLVCSRNMEMEMTLGTRAGGRDKTGETGGMETEN